MKTKWLKRPDEFYIGYLDKAPEGTASLLKKTIVGLAAIILIIAVLLVKGQRPFSDSEFEYGTYTTLEGRIYNYPVPHLKLKSRLDSSNETNPQTVLLVSDGKAGANKTLPIFESAVGSLDGKLVKITGQTIHGKGKTLMQIDEDHLPEVLRDESDQKSPTDLTTMGTPFNVTGEIVDPKCYFGVMKPGEGKTHRSCAIRCISGGIPPVFHVTNSADYFLLLDENYQPVNQLVLDIVGDKIELSGKLVEWDDWKILLINKDILKSLTTPRTSKRNLASINDGITRCGD